MDPWLSFLGMNPGWPLWVGPRRNWNVSSSSASSNTVEDRSLKLKITVYCTCVIASYFTIENSCAIVIEISQQVLLLKVPHKCAVGELSAVYFILQYSMAILPVVVLP